MVRMPKTPKPPSSKAARIATEPFPLRPKAQSVVDKTPKQSSTPITYGVENLVRDTSGPRILEDRWEVPSTKLDDDHVADIRIFARDLHQSLEGAFPPKSCPYTSVYVLLLQWEADDIGVKEEISQLRRVFRNQFNFDVENWYIPSSNSFHSLQDKIYQFQKAHQSRLELLIVYYGGHAEADTSRGRSIWHANSNAKPSLDWFNIQPLLLTAKPNVLIILDCCYAANAVRDTTEGPSKEILAACARENQTPGADPHSFTSVLVKELQEFGHTSFTVSMLYSRLMTRRGTLKSTPIYVPLSDIGGSSITLCPVPKDLNPVAHELPCPVTPLTAPDCQEGVMSATPSPSNSLLPPNPDLPLVKPETRVLLSISVSQEVKHSLAEWVSWLTNDAPWDVTKVEVQVKSIYKSHSTLVLVSIPIIGWNRLRRTSAYRFIGFTESEDLLANDEPKTPPGMITRRQKRKPNINQVDNGLMEQLVSKKAKRLPEAFTETIPESLTPPLSTPSRTRGLGRLRKSTADVTPHHPRRFQVSSPQYSPLSTIDAKGTRRSRYRPASQPQSPEERMLLAQKSQLGMDWQPTIPTQVTNEAVGLPGGELAMADRRNEVPAA
ncbi:hypothetical protein N7G274_010520 [Stereocaulon virgatum]|uniref:Uncharacterized protein n=1 Tax=Stereocaulon virgatum TaxID=373712 RepID=A0ABR3ZTC5_9LECA